MGATIKAYGALAAGFKVTPEIKKAAEKARDFAVKTLRGNTPVDTGLLKASWEVELSGYGIEISNSTPYGIFVEMGTRRMDGRHMVTKSLPVIQDYFRKELGRSVGKKLATRIVGDLKPGTDAYEALTQGTAVRPAAPNFTKGLGFKSGKPVGLQDHPLRV